MDDEERIGEAVKMKMKGTKCFNVRLLFNSLCIIYCLPLAVLDRVVDINNSILSMNL